MDGQELPGRGSDQIGLVPFAREPEDTCPLTLSHDVLLELLDAEEPRGALDSGTNIGDALAWGLKRLEAAGDRRKVLVLLSDGEHNVPGGLTPRQAGQLAANQGVPVYCIDAGPPVTPPSQDPGPPDETLEITVYNTHGLHLRPAAALVSALAGLDARVELENLTKGRGAADAKSLVELALLQI